MKEYSGIFVILLCIVSIFAAGCTNQTTETVPTTTPALIQTTVIPTTVIPVTSMTSEISEIPTITPNETTVLPTLFPKADSTDVSEINFSYYSDSDFSMYYPSTWNVTKSSYTPYVCENVLDPDRKDYHICYLDEKTAFAPFTFREDVNLKKPYRIVTITSSDKTMKFSSLVEDFKEGYTGYFRLNPDIQWCKALFSLYYPNLSPEMHISNYKYSSNGNAMQSIHDVQLPYDSKYSPSAYSIKAIVTMHHVYEFGFSTDIEHFSKYQNLKDKMMGSIKTFDAV